MNLKKILDISMLKEGDVDDILYNKAIEFNKKIFSIDEYELEDDIDDEDDYTDDDPILEDDMMFKVSGYIKVPVSII